MVWQRTRVDRSGDALRHANLAGTSKLGESRNGHGR